MKNDILIGIDPDVDKSGVAFLDVKTKKIELCNLSFFDLYNYLEWVKQESVKHKSKLLVRVECGFLNKSNWHKSKKGSPSLNAKIGERTGANFQTAKHICEMCEYLNIPYEQIRPSKSKVKHDYFVKLTGMIGRTNQEQRDAAMLVWF